MPAATPGTKKTERAYAESRRQEWKKQYAALPFCKQYSGIKIMLITTRNKGRWSTPKGGGIGNRNPHRTPAIEAYEVGLVGAIEKRAVGNSNTRRGGADNHTPQAFPMKVRLPGRWWPEKGQRKVIWVSVEAARGMVHKEQLRQLIARRGAHTSLQTIVDIRMLCRFVAEGNIQYARDRPRNRLARTKYGLPVTDQAFRIADLQAACQAQPTGLRAIPT
jgi:hypothetical protein